MYEHQDEAIRFNQVLNRVLGENTVINESDEFSPELKLARKLKELDLSPESNIKETLHQNIMESLYNNKEQNGGELDEHDLSLAAGGVGGDKSGNICPECGPQSARNDRVDGKCPHCGRK